MVCLCGFATMAVAESVREGNPKKPALAAGKDYTKQCTGPVV